MTTYNTLDRWMTMTPFTPLKDNGALADLYPELYAKLWKKHVAAAIIQRMARGHLARKMVNNMKTESMFEELDPVCEDMLVGYQYSDYEECPICDYNSYFRDNWVGCG
jgi:hypothetical protein